jgi:GNAT superfamily N-acetyltransferase
VGPQSGGVVRTVVRTATGKDLDLLVRHRRLMWEAIADFSIRDHDAADAVYRRWARDRMRSRRFAGFIVEVGAEPVASGCVWIMDVQPRPGRSGTAAAYLLSMFTEPDHRGEGHATRIVRAAIRWARSRGIPIMLLHASDFGEPIYRRLGFERTREMRRPLVRAPRRKARSSRKTLDRATH